MANQKIVSSRIDRYECSLGQLYFNTPKICHHDFKHSGDDIYHPVFKGQELGGIWEISKPGHPYPTLQLFIKVAGVYVWVYVPVTAGDTEIWL